jgi:hypothetical protein
MDQKATAPATENLALGKPYTLWPNPNYQYCTDPDDKTQLTDGKSTNLYFWTQLGTVGWNSPAYALITVDLGRVEPISGVAFTTAAGAAGVNWPAEIHILVSDDDKSYRDVGDLARLDQKTNGPWPQGYAIRRVVTGDLATRGRYVRFMPITLAGGSYLFVDEVEVFRGPEELLTRDPGGEPIKDPQAFFEEGRARRAVRIRITTDVAALRQRIDQAQQLDATTKARLLQRLDQLSRQADPAELPIGPDFRALLPLGEAHARLFQLQAEWWKAAGLPEFSASTAVTWDPLELIGLPTRSEAPLTVHTMRGEYRAAAVNLVNASNRVLEARLHLEGLPGSPAPGYLTVHDVPWTDTIQTEPVAAALPEAKRVDGGWTVSIQPGLLRQVWLTFHVTDQPAGQHTGKMIVEVPGLPPQQVPVQLRIWPLEFPKQTTLYLGGWEYTDAASMYGVTPDNKAALLEHLQSHFVNAPWATSAVMMNYAFDKSDPAKIQLNTQRFDDWIALWPNARRYLVFLAVGDYDGTHAPSFAGADMGTFAFNQRVATWIHAWISHLRDKGVRPNQLGLLVYDEPGKETNVAGLVAWAKAIRAAEPEVLVWEDPVYEDPAKAPPELFQVSSILCPNRPQWLSHAARFDAFYSNQRKQERTLELYSCSGPARLLDPYAYYRLQAWHCWKIGGTGTYFWAFGDNSGASSWCEYYAGRAPYTPLFLDRRTVTAGKHMEAIRESVEDYEYFVMLRDAVQRATAAGKSAVEIHRAETLLGSAADEVLGADGVNNLFWHDPKDRTKADTVRVRILEALEALK